MVDRDTHIDASSEAKEELRDLDGILPESVDRRSFFKGALALGVGGLLAGCSSGDGSSGSGDSGGSSGGSSGSSGGSSGGSGDTTRQQTSQGSGVIQRNVVWRTAWKASPNYATSYIAQLQGFWADQNITPPNASKGFGSGDTAKRVGTGKENLGLGSVTPVVSGLAEGYNLSIYGTAKARSQIAMMYRADRLDGPSDIVDKTIVSASALNTQAWPMYAKAVGHADVELESAEESAAAAMLVSGDADAVFDTYNDLGSLQQKVEENTDTTVKAAPLYNQVPVYGYVLYVNNDWLGEKNNHEYAARALTGYSHAMKWVLLNPEQAIEIMRQDVNQALQTQSKEALLDQIKAGVATTNLTEGVKENGLCYLNEDVLDNSLTEIANAIGTESTEVDAAADFSIQEDAELATFSKDEWNQATEFAKPFTSLFS